MPCLPSNQWMQLLIKISPASWYGISQRKNQNLRPSLQIVRNQTSWSLFMSTTLSAETVDNIIGKLRALFVDLGRGREWNELLGIRNPASHHSIRQYVTSIREEKAQARVIVVTQSGCG